MIHLHSPARAEQKAVPGKGYISAKPATVVIGLGEPTQTLELRERGAWESVHFSEAGYACLKCSARLGGSNPWTDNIDLYERHEMRCDRART